MIDDIFCKIIRKELPAEIVMEEGGWLAIKDIRPQALVHVLIIPKKHLAGLAEAGPKDGGILAELTLAANKVAQKTGVADRGFRLIINEGRDGGQMVPHFHIHLLGGQSLGAKIVAAN